MQMASHVVNLLAKAQASTDQHHGHTWLLEFSFVKVLGMVHQGWEEVGSGLTALQHHHA